MLRDQLKTKGMVLFCQLGQYKKIEINIPVSENCYKVTKSWSDRNSINILTIGIISIEIIQRLTLIDIQKKVEKRQKLMF